MISDIRPSIAGCSPSPQGTPKNAVPPEPSGDHWIPTAEAGQPVRLTQLLAATATEAQSVASKMGEHVEGEVVVKLKPSAEATRSGLADFADTYGATLLEKIEMPNPMRNSFNGELLHLQLAKGMSTADAIAAMHHDPRVNYAVPNDILHADEAQGRSAESLPPNLSPNLWGMKNQDNPGVDIHAGGAWFFNTGSRKGPILAVVDTGLDYNHKALKDNIWTDPQNGSHGFNAITGSNDPMDDHYHGTHCSGTIAGNGTDGLYGVNQKAQIMGVKFLNSSGSGQLTDAIKGIIFAEQHGARVMSNSWAGGPFNQALHDTMASTTALQVCAAGNDSNNNDGTPAYPAGYHTDNMLVVAASDNRDNLASFSNYGNKTVDLAAPGVQIYSSAPGDKYKYLDGTSMATPHVAGAALLLATEFPGISNEEIKARLLYNVDDVPAFHGKIASGGRLNLAAAMKHDTTPPGTPANLTLGEVRAGRVNLNWVAAGDDGDTGGKAAAYELRYSDKPIVEGAASADQTRFGDARLVNNTDRPNLPGSKEKVSIGLPLLGSDKTYYFAMRAIDHVGQKSPLATISATVPAAKVAFVDDKNPANWIADGTWAQVNDPDRGKVWTDSPGGDYQNNANTSLTSKPINLAGMSGSRLIFDEKHATEPRYDRVFVEASSDGKSWNGLTSYTGSSDWNSQALDLSAYDGKTVQIRYRLNSDASTTGDGIYLDNVVVASGS